MVEKARDSRSVRSTGSLCRGRVAAVTNSLFRLGSFRGAAGEVLPWKVECDSLWQADWEALAEIAVSLLPDFGTVEGVPTGGFPFADALREHVTAGPLLIADDVLTTGGSMVEHRDGRDAIGVVAFARGVVPDWITPVWRLGGSPVPRSQ